MNKMVSVIIPIYNSEKFLKDSIQSILNQTYKNIELILIDDGSTDNSLSICRYFEKKDRRIKIISTDNKGVSNARNLGVKNAKGKYLMFCDADDLYYEKCIQTMVESLEDNNSELAFCQYHRFKEGIDNKKLIINNEIINYCDSNDIFNIILFDDKIAGYVWNKIFIRKIINQNNIYFDSTIHEIEDLRFVFEYLKYIKKVTKVNDQLYFYRDNPTSIMNQSFNLKKYSSIYGRIAMYKEIKNLNVNDEIKKRVLIQAIQCCFSHLKNIIITFNFKKKKTYVKEILLLFNSIHQDYKKYSNYNNIIKFKYFILNLIAYLLKLLRIKWI